MAKTIESAIEERSSIAAAAGYAGVEPEAFQASLEADAAERSKATHAAIVGVVRQIKAALNTSKSSPEYDVVAVTARMVLTAAVAAIVPSVKKALKGDAADVRRMLIESWTTARPSLDEIRDQFVETFNQQSDCMDILIASLDAGHLSQLPAGEGFSMGATNLEYAQRMLDVKESASNADKRLYAAAKNA